MALKVGNKIQAVDELGRWENATIEAIDYSAQLATVSFVGWDADFNVTNPLSQIRKPVNVFVKGIGMFIYTSLPLFCLLDLKLNVRPL